MHNTGFSGLMSKLTVSGSEGAKLKRQVSPQDATTETHEMKRFHSGVAPYGTLKLGLLVRLKRLKSLNQFATHL